MEYRRCSDDTCGALQLVLGGAPLLIDSLALLLVLGVAFLSLHGVTHRPLVITLLLLPVLAFFLLHSLALLILYPLTPEVIDSVALLHQLLGALLLGDSLAALGLDLLTHLLSHRVAHLLGHCLQTEKMMLKAAISLFYAHHTTTRNNVRSGNNAKKTLMATLSCLQPRQGHFISPDIVAQ